MPLHGRPRLKIIRRLGVPLPGLTRKVLRREAPARTRLRRVSDYGRQLAEKQKVRYHYGVTETQLRRYYRMAASRPGVTGEILLSLLERRLDSVVFRLGFAPTIPAARQLVSHGHIDVDGRRTTVPGYSVRTGQSVSVAPQSRDISVIQEGMQARDSRRLPSFLEVDPGDPFQAKVTGTPRREDVPFVLDEAAVVAYYSRR